MHSARVRTAHIDGTTVRPSSHWSEAGLNTRLHTHASTHTAQGVLLTFVSSMSSTDRDRPPRPLLLGRPRDSIVSLLCLCNGGVELLSITDPLPVPQSKGENMVPLLKEKRIVCQSTAPVTARRTVGQLQFSPHCELLITQSASTHALACIQDKHEPPRMLL